jgi:putative salt-induced outer membrane protein YdiY
MLDTFWMFLALLQGPAPIAAPPLPATIDPALLPVSAIVAPLLLASAEWPPTPETAAPAEVPRSAARKTPLVRGKAELSYVSTGGTASTQTIGTGGELAVTPGLWRVESRASFLRTRTDGAVRARRLNGQIRTARQVGERAELFARGTYLRNTFAGIDNSVDGAAGVTAILVRTEPQRLSLDSGFGYIGEDRTRGPGRYVGTFDLGMRHYWEFARRNRISNDASVKADIERSSDWRLTHVAALQAALNAVLALKLSHELTYRNEPVPGFTRADTVASAALVATF